MIGASLTRPEAATLALAELGGAEHEILTEDIAVRLETVAPGMFSWQKHRDRTDKELVRVALSDARLKSGFVIGSHLKGWMLTPDGVRFAEKSEHRTGRSGKQRSSLGEAQAARERSRLMETVAFQWVQAGELDRVTIDEADAFFRLNVYVRGESREKKIARIENLFGSDLEIGPVVVVLATKARERE